MTRKAVIFQESVDGKRCVAVDMGNAEAILAYITQDARHEKKFRHIVELILNGLRNPELYDKEEINERAKGVTAMNLFKGQENDQIYCKEFTDKGKIFGNCLGRQIQANYLTISKLLIFLIYELN